MSNFDSAYAIVAGAKVEGGLSLDPKDKGNWTGGEVGKGILKGSNHGISAAMYPDEDIANLTSERIKFLFEHDYWKPYGCEAMEWGKALIVFDTAVNGGLTSRWLARHRAKLVDEFMVDWQADHILWLTTLPQWDHNKVGWTKRAFFIFQQAMRTPK